MNEAKAYEWAGQALRACNGEPHRGQQCADNVAAAILVAYRQGIVDMFNKTWNPKTKRE